ncbi:hypothetical protein F183_A04250 [Bryobacterales bacterium F-183]|nr:hypothetical protein F183_A04250 [Bryobacterales bacterium F-183]
MPGRVEHRVRASLRAAQRPGKGWNLAVLAAAAMAVVFFVFEPDLGQMETLLVSSALRPGLADHIHCTLHRGLMRHNGPLEDPLLVEAVSGAIPDGYRVAMCHRCQFRGRPYIHVALTDGESKLVSLIVTRKQEGEGMAKPTTSRTVRFAVSGSETHDHLVYVVSGLENQQNETLLAALEPKIQKYLQITPQKM